RMEAIATEESAQDAQDLSRTARHMLAKPLTASRAARLIAEFTLLATLVGGTLAWLIDRDDFHTLGTGLWWSLQTVTTRRHPALPPSHAEGRVIATFVMLAGLAFLAVITASVTAAFVENARKRYVTEAADEVAPHLRRLGDELHELNSRLDRVET